MIKIASLYRAPNGTREPFNLEYTTEDFGIPEIQGPIKASGHFMRVEEGIMMLIETLEATQVAHCSRCGKALKLKLDFKPSEWLFYEENPHEDDASNEWLELDAHRLELNPLEPLRQDLLLNLKLVPHCKKLCKKFEESKKEEEGVKALSELKDLLKGQSISKQGSRLSVAKKRK